MREGIAWEHIAFADNQPCVHLIDSRASAPAPASGPAPASASASALRLQQPRGGCSSLLPLLDEQCALPSGSDAQLASEIRRQLGGHPCFAAPRTAPLRFVLRHYAADVTYDITSFCEKNRDALPEAAAAAMQATPPEPAEAYRPLARGTPLPPCAPLPDCHPAPSVFNCRGGAGLERPLRAHSLHRLARPARRPAHRRARRRARRRRAHRRRAHRHRAHLPARRAGGSPPDSGDTLHPAARRPDADGGHHRRALRALCQA